MGPGIANQFVILNQDAQQSAVKHSDRWAPKEKMVYDAIYIYPLVI